MSSHYNTEPPPTAAATLHTTAGDLHISLFAKQTPLTCKNFIQHCLDGYYVGTTFHRIVPGFVVQAGDPTGTGSGGASIYEDPEFEYDYSREPAGEKVVFKDEIHSRLRFNRRGLVGMAKSEDGTYGSQFFVTLGPADREMTGKYTMFGRLEGDSIYTILRIAEGELIEGTERPAFAVKITGCEVDNLGPFEGVLRKRDKVASVPEGDAAKKKKKKKQKQKGGKALLSFADEEDDEEAGQAVPIKPKFNTRLVADTEMPSQSAQEKGNSNASKTEPPRTSFSSVPTRASEETRPSRKRSLPPERSRTPPILRKPPRDPNTQLPLPDPEEPSRSPSSSPPPSPKKSSLSRTNAEIESLKASMRRHTSLAVAEPPRKKTALESLIPETSIRGRKRPPPGSTPAATASNGFKPNGSQGDEAIRMFNAFKAKLENADFESKSKPKAEANTTKPRPEASQPTEPDTEDEEAIVCDLHFIANCQSCRAWDEPADFGDGGDTEQAEKDEDWLTHRLSFAKDTLGKDLNWKRKNQEADDLMVIDPRQKEKEIVGGRKREKERRRKMEGGGNREWDQRGRKDR